MSRVQPPVSAVPLAKPLLANAPGAGQVVAVDGMNESMRKWPATKWLENTLAVVESVHVAASGARCCQVHVLLQQTRERGSRLVHLLGSVDGVAAAR